MKRVLADRRGAVLVEFALVALAATLLLSATVDLGRLVFTAQVIQDAARAGARELSVTPLPAAITFDAALSYVDPATLQQPVRLRVFDPDRLVIDTTGMTDADLDLIYASLPIVNKILRPAMITDRISIGGAERTLLRYPGALLEDAASASGFSVLIPRVTGRTVDGVETVEWIPVAEEVRADPSDPTTGPFSLVPGAAIASGLVALRINYPFQAATMSSFRPNPLGPFEPNLGNVNIADDAAVSAPPTGGTLVDSTGGGGVYAGPYGLGRQFAFAGQTVRPFRRLLSSQAVYRREVFQ